MGELTLGQLAARSGVPATTLRYYDRIGLLPAGRRPNGHRRYPEAAVGLLRIVQLCRGLGCSLDETRAVLAPGTSDARRSLAVAKLAETDRRLADLAAARLVLDHLAACEHGPGEGEQCRRTVVTLLAGVPAPATGPPGPAAGPAATGPA